MRQTGKESFRCLIAPTRTRILIAALVRILHADAGLCAVSASTATWPSANSQAAVSRRTSRRHTTVHSKPSSAPGVEGKSPNRFMVARQNAPALLDRSTPGTQGPNLEKRSRHQALGADHRHERAGERMFRRIKQECNMAVHEQHVSSCRYVIEVVYRGRHNVPHDRYHALSLA